MADVQTSTFRYPPLDEHPLAFRILTLEPSSEWDDPISCRLHNQTLNSHEPEYEALSYTWDDGELASSILLDGHPYKISPNLSAFLRHQRERKHSVQLWADGICINQTDPEEKARQVGIMNSIYLASPKLVIWLGPAANDSDLAMETLSALGSRTPFAKMPILSDKVLRSVKALLNRRWWSRVWILQEVYWGGCGVKLNDMRVRCGRWKILWTNLVVAAARMQAQANDIRQYFPSIEHILRLEKLRNHARKFALNSIEDSDVLRLVAFHRSSQATDVRDKIFALLGMIFRNCPLYKMLKISYSRSVKQIYTDLAIILLSSQPSLEILRHCNERFIEDLPSWVPDWSVCCIEEPLEGPSLLHLSEKPWYFKSLSGFDSQSEEQSGIMPRKPVQVFKKEDNERDIMPFEIPDSRTQAVRLYSLSHQMQRNLSSDTKTALQEAIDQNRLIVISDNDYADDTFSTSEELEDVQKRIIKKGEIVTQRTVESSFDAILSDPLVQYRAAGFTMPQLEFIHSDPTPSVDPTLIEGLTLHVEGVIWDKITKVRPPFPTKLDAHWENATHFLVAIAQCKDIFLTSQMENNPYSTLSARELAFWLTLFAGRTKSSSGQDLSAKIIALAPFWLRPLPKCYRPSQAPLTTVSPGRLRCVDTGQVIQQSIQANDSDGYVEVDYGGVAMRPDLQPDEWTDSDRIYYRMRFDALASLWQQTPYDLYTRPFDLPAVVPDPYWTCRQQDHVLLARARKRRFNQFLAVGETRSKEENKREESDSAIDPSLDNASALRESIENELRKVVPLVPDYEDVLDPGFERYALGRRMFRTAQGYLGIGPRGLQEGDVVAIMKGLEVPLVLRERADGRFEVVGETYVHGVMNGEAFDEANTEWIKLA